MIIHVVSIKVLNITLIILFSKLILSRVVDELVMFMFLGQYLVLSN